MNLHVNIMDDKVSIENASEIWLIGERASITTYTLLISIGGVYRGVGFVVFENA